MVSVPICHPSESPEQGSASEDILIAWIDMGGPTLIAAAGSPEERQRKIPLATKIICPLAAADSFPEVRNSISKLSSWIREQKLSRNLQGFQQQISTSKT